MVWMVLFFTGLSYADETVTDAAGRRIVVKRPFTRIISLYGGHTENLLALGLAKEIIGVNDDGIDDPGTSGKPVFSYHDGPEKFMAARPDLILIRPMIDRAYAGLFKRLEQSGITVVSLQPGSVAAMYGYWKDLGILTGKTGKAESMARDFKRELGGILEKTRRIKVKKRVYFEAMHRQMKTFSKDSMAVFCLESAGGINVAPDAVPSRGTNIGIYGKEKILAHASDIDVYLVQTGRMNRADIAEIRNEPGFSVIKAVKENKIYAIDEMLVSRPTFRLIDGIKSIGAVLYPDLFMGKKKGGQ
jgi:iron complex transport system substrate-binding protein